MVGETKVATGWISALSDVNVIVHLAARVHVMRDTAIDPLTAFRAFNLVGTLNLVRQAAAAEVKRFVYKSMAQATEVPVRLLRAVVWFLQAGTSLLGMGYALQRLCGNLQVDVSKALSLLGWAPPVYV